MNRKSVPSSLKHFFTAKKISILPLHAFLTLFLIVFFHSLLPAASTDSLKYPVLKRIDRDPIKLTVKKAWEKQLNEKLLSRPFIWQGSAFTVFAGGRIEAFDLRTGEQKWNREIEDLEGIISLQQGMILARCGDLLVMLRAEDGVKIRELPLLPGTLHSYSYENSGIHFLFPDSLWHFDLEAGNFIMDAKIALKDAKPTSFVYDGGRYAAFVMSEGRVDVYHVKKGKKLWSFQGGSRILAPPVIWQKKLVVMCEDNFFYCLDMKNGNLIYRKKSDNRLLYAGEKIRGTILFSPFASKNLTMLHMATGQLEPVFSLSAERYHFIFPPSYNDDYLVAAYADFFSENNFLIVFEAEIKEERLF